MRPDLSPPPLVSCPDPDGPAADLLTAVLHADAFNRAGRRRRARWLAVWTVMRHDPAELARALALAADTRRDK